MTPSRARAETARRRGASFPPDAWERMCALRDALDHVEWARENGGHVLTAADVLVGLGIRRRHTGWTKLPLQLAHELRKVRAK